MDNFADTFRSKKITVMGLGLLGRGLGDISFLAKCQADLIVTDLKKSEELQPSINLLKDYKEIKYTLGKHQFKDFGDRDFILKAAGVAIDSPYIKEAKRNNIPIKMSASWFAELVKGVTIVGVTGTRGKSTVSHLLYEILRYQRASVYIGGNVKGISTLALLEFAKAGDIVVLELDSWQLQGFGESQLSPNISIFTNFLDDHLNYYKGDRNAYFKDKSNIFKYQKRGDFLIIGEEMEGKIRKENPKSQIVLAKAGKIPENWEIKIIGEHNRRNIACAVAAAKILGVSENEIRNAVERFDGLDGRLKYLGEIKGVRVYNDNSSTTPDATIAALCAIGDEDNNKKKIILIAGGADKGLDFENLVSQAALYCKAIVLFKETGTERLKSEILTRGLHKEIKVFEEETLEDCIKAAYQESNPRDVILWSPAFASFGRIFKNEFDREEKFLKALEDFGR